MKPFLAFILKETRHILRDPRTMLILFGMPVVMMLLFGFAISTDVRNVRTAVVLSETDHRTARMTEALGANSYFDIVATVPTPDEAKRLVRDQKVDLALVFPYGFASRQSDIQVIADGTDPNMAQLYANYAIQILISHGLATAPDTTAPTADAGFITASLLYNPQMRSCYNFVPGIMGMLLMLTCAMMTSVSIVREKERGTMEVLLAGPVRPLTIIVAKAVPYLALALVIQSSILVISKYVLLVPLAGSVGWIFAVSGLYIIVALSLGLLISTAVRTQLAALLASAMMLIMPCIMLSGMMFPIESMPRILQYISAVMPPRYYISAMRKLMIMGVDIDKAYHETGALALMAGILLTGALTKFNKRLE